MKSLRRLWRVLTLAGQWVRYVLGCGSPRLALSDFAVWVRTTWLGHNLFDLDLPWLCFPAARFLNQRIEPGMRVFEWGSGASTLFFGRRGCRVVSIEHDLSWLESLDSRVREHGEVEVLPISDADEEYIRAIERFAPGTLDLVLVDGNRRCECLTAALSRVRRGGWLILDDSERAMYRSCLSGVPERDWEARHFHGPKPSSVWPAFTRTTCLRRRTSTDSRRPEDGS